MSNKPKDLLVVKRKHDSFLRMKVKRKAKKKNWDSSYNHIIDVRDYKALAGFFCDIKIMFDAPVEKAFREMKKDKGPFW